MEIRKFRIITVLADIAILAVSFMFLVWIKPASLRYVLPSHTPFFIVLAIVWIIVSLANGKMHRGRIINYSTLFTRVLTSNIIAVSLTALIMYSLRDYGYSRTVVLGTAILATLMELITGMAYIAYRKARFGEYAEAWDQPLHDKRPSEFELVNGTNGNGNGNGNGHSKTVHPSIALAIEQECGAETARSILGMISKKLDEETAVLSTTTVFNITGLTRDRYKGIINLHKVNDIKKLDLFLDTVNSKLVKGGYFFCCVETKDQRKQRILRKYPPALNYIIYSLDFLVKRVFPKLKLTKWLYTLFTRGENMVISRAEALGRLSRSGFKIRQESFIGKLLCIECVKAGDPVVLRELAYGPMIALPRIGMDGKTIKVYKLRTMHPYSEFIQDYLYKIHDLQDGGKFKNDFRITSWGSFCRKVWLDEVPMIINYMKGEMKLIGVRPLSRQYFNLYRPEVRLRRIRYKPGLIPPFYADLPEDLEQIQESELKYLDSFDKSPVLTDIRYFFKSVWNIFFRKARSK